MANLSLGISLLVQIDVLIWSASVNPAQSYTWLSFIICVCACVKCMLKLCMVMLLWIKFMSNESKSNLLTLNLTLKIFAVNFRRISQEMKIFCHKKILHNNIQHWIFPNYSIPRAPYSYYKLNNSCMIKASYSKDFFIIAIINNSNHSTTSESSSALKATHARGSRGCPQENLEF